MTDTRLLIDVLTNPKLTDKQRIDVTVSLFKKTESRVLELETVVKQLKHENDHLPETVFDILGKLMNTAAEATRGYPENTHPPVEIRSDGEYTYVGIGEGELENDDTLTVYLDEEGYVHLGIMDGEKFIPKLLNGADPAKLKHWVLDNDIPPNQYVSVNVYFTPHSIEA